MERALPGESNADTSTRLEKLAANLRKAADELSAIVEDERRQRREPRGA
jgi:hypothetical protein